MAHVKELSLHTGQEQAVTGPRTIVVRDGRMTVEKKVANAPQRLETFDAAKLAVPSLLSTEGAQKFSVGGMDVFVATQQAPEAVQDGIQVSKQQIQVVDDNGVVRTTTATVVEFASPDDAQTFAGMLQKMIALQTMSDNEPRGGVTS